MYRYCVSFVLILILSCDHASEHRCDALSSTEGAIGALLLSQYESLEDLEKDVDISYSVTPYSTKSNHGKKREVLMSHRVRNGCVTSILKTGVNEGDFNQARDGNLMDRIKLAFKTPFAVLHKNDLVSIELLGRRRYEMFGEGDIAFYDLAEQMVRNIRKEFAEELSEKDLSEKGYLNTFNHIVAQAIMTAVYSEQLADFVADVHERYTMPELMTGEFSPEQLSDIEKGPVDNYVDMINNEWGQELGKRFLKKHNITKGMKWTPELLTELLNFSQQQCGHALGIRFHPFRPSDEMVVRFADKINKTNSGVTGYIEYYFARVKPNMNC